MLFNLGMTADAAAAHRHEFSSPSSTAQSSPPTAPTSPSTSPASGPAIAFAVLPSFNLSCPFNLPAPLHHVKDILTMPSNPASTRPSTSDDDFSATRSDTAAETRTINSSSGRRRSHRSKTSFQLAHPPRNPRHKRLRLRPKLLLQLQQVSHTPRPVPTLDVLPSIIYVPRLARRFPSMFKRKDGLGPNDLIVVNSDTYNNLRAEEDERSVSEEDESEDHREVVATICQLLTEDARQKGKVEICLRYGSPWEATSLSNGSYEFVTETEQGPQIVRWVLRGKSNRRISAPAGIASLEAAKDNKRFTFSVIDPTTRRHPVIGSMTRTSIDVYHQYTIPSPSSDATMSPLSPTSVMSVPDDLNDPTGRVMDTDDHLRTLIMITGIYVAFREGWSQDPLYNDLLNGTASSNCSPIRPRHQVTLAVPDETEGSTDGDGHRRSLHLMGSMIRQSTSMRRNSHSLPPSESSKSLAGTSRPTRTNSTGAAFMERVNRRSASAASARSKCHTVFAGATEENPISPGFGSSQPLPPRSSGRSDKRETTNGARDKPAVEPTVATPDRRDQRQTRGVSRGMPQADISSPTTDQAPDKKGKRWRRLSHLFGRRSTH